MMQTILKLEMLLDTAVNYLNAATVTELEAKPAPDKWSKKEILGHLIDSALHNLQRFVEVQFESKPYTVRKYKQDECVAANDYQHADIEGLTQCWLSLNRRIIHLMNLQTPDTLAFEVVIDDKTTEDLRFLMTDYVEHLEHHLNQIRGL